MLFLFLLAIWVICADLANQILAFFDMRHHHMPLSNALAEATQGRGRMEEEGVWEVSANNSCAEGDSHAGSSQGALEAKPPPARQDVSAAFPLQLRCKLAIRHFASSASQPASCHGSPASRPAGDPCQPTPIHADELSCPQKSGNGGEHELQGLGGTAKQTQACITDPKELQSVGHQQGGAGPQRGHRNTSHATPYRRIRGKQTCLVHADKIIATQSKQILQYAPASAPASVIEPPKCTRKRPCKYAAKRPKHSKRTHRCPEDAAKPSKQRRSAKVVHGSEKSKKCPRSRAAKGSCPRRRGHRAGQTCADPTASMEGLQVTRRSRCARKPRKPRRTRKGVQGGPFIKSCRKAAHKRAADQRVNELIKARARSSVARSKNLE